MIEIMDIFRENLIAIIFLGFLASIILFLRWPRSDRVEKVFLKAGIQASPVIVNELRENIGAIVAETERQRVTDFAKHQSEMDAIRAEKERIVSLVRSSPYVVKEVGEALKGIEKEFIRVSKAVKSEQAKEVLRLSAEREIRNILKSVGTSPNQLPEFQLYDNHRLSTLEIPRAKHEWAASD